MKPLRTLACWLVIISQCWAGVTHHDTTGRTLYVRVQTGASTFKGVALTEGSSGGLGVYNVTDAALVSAGLTSTDGDYPFSVRVGSASDTANDLIVGSGVLGWTGTVERPVKASLSDAAIAAVAAVVGGGPIEQRTVASERVLVVTRNADTGDLIVGSKVKMKASEQFLYALEFKGTLLAPGTNLFGMSTPTLSGTDAANMEVEDSGVLGTQAKFEVSTTSGAAVDDEITITVPVQLSATETINVEVEVEIRP